MSDFAVAETFRYTTNHVGFPGREQRLAARTQELHGKGLSHGFEKELEFCAVRPDLAFVDTADGFREQLKRLGTAENTARAGAEGFDHRGTLGRIQKHDDACRRRGGTNLAAQAKSTTAVSALSRADEGNVRAFAFQHGHDLGFLRRRASDIELAVAAQGLDQ